MSLDLSKLTTRKGANLVFHFEDESDAAMFTKGVNLKNLQNSLRHAIEMTDVDKGKGTKVHLLLNSEHDMVILNEEDFAEWDGKPEKDWHHNLRRPRMSSLIPELVSLLMLTELLGDLEDVLGNPKKDYTEPTEAQLEKYRAIEAADAVYRKNRIATNCVLCLRVGCPIRHASFAEALFEKAISEYQPTTD